MTLIKFSNFEFSNISIFQSVHHVEKLPQNFAPQPQKAKALYCHQPIWVDDRFGEFYFDFALHSSRVEL